MTGIRDLKHPSTTFFRFFCKRAHRARVYIYACVRLRSGARGGTAGRPCQDWFAFFVPLTLRHSRRGWRVDETKVVLVMVKIRVQGLPDEVEEFTAELENLRRWEVLEESADYANRGGSKLVRRYVEVERVEEV